MVDEKKLEGLEKKPVFGDLEKKPDEQENLEKDKATPEKLDEDQKRQKEALGEISKTSATVVKKEDDHKQVVKDLKDLESAEDQIEKLIQIASEDGPTKAIKVAKTLNSNYALDNMHDRMIDEETLHQKLQEKGFI